MGDGDKGNDGGARVAEAACLSGDRRRVRKGIGRAGRAERRGAARGARGGRCNAAVERRTGTSGWGEEGAGAGALRGEKKEEKEKEEKNRGGEKRRD